MRSEALNTSHSHLHTHTVWHSDGATQPDPRESDCSAAATSSVSLTDTLCLSSVTLRFQSAVPDGAARLGLLLFSHSRLLLTLSRWNKSGRVFLFYMKITHRQFLCNYCYQGQTFCAHHIPETFSSNWKKSPHDMSFSNSSEPFISEGVDGDNILVLCFCIFANFYLSHTP